MGKIPYVEYTYGGMGLTGECAYLWACFLANEADMDNDVIAYDKWTALAETLRPQQGKAMPASLHCSYLEDEIKKYTQDREYIYPGSDPQE